jgi:hypothetical protein
MTITIPTREIRKNDKIMAVDGHVLRHNNPVVAQVIDTEGHSVHVHVKVDDHTIVTPDRYLPYKEVTVERTKRPTRRTFEGITFIKQDDGSWQTEDGEWTIGYVDDFETECDAPHPVKISAETRAAFWADSEWDRNTKWDFDIATAIRDGKKGYYCEGGKPHFYALWVAGDTGGSDVVNREEAFVDSARHLARFIQGKDERRA